MKNKILSIFIIITSILIWNYYSQASKILSQKKSNKKGYDGISWNSAIKKVSKRIINKYRKYSIKHKVGSDFIYFKYKDSGIIYGEITFHFKNGYFNKVNIIEYFPANSIGGKTLLKKSQNTKKIYNLESSYYEENTTKQLSSSWIANGKNRYFELKKDDLIIKINGGDVTDPMGVTTINYFYEIEFLPKKYNNNLELVEDDYYGPCYYYFPLKPGNYWIGKGSWGKVKSEVIKKKRNYFIVLEKKKIFERSNIFMFEERHYKHEKGQLINIKNITYTKAGKKFEGEKMNNVILKEPFILGTNWENKNYKYVIISTNQTVTVGENIFNKCIKIKGINKENEKKVYYIYYAYNIGKILITTDEKVNYELLEWHVETK